MVEPRSTVGSPLRDFKPEERLQLVHDRLVAVGEIDRDIADGKDLMIAEYDRRDPADVDLALDRRRGLVRLNRGRMAAVDHVVSVQADIDEVGPTAALHEFIAVVDVDCVVSAAD